MPEKTVFGPAGTSVVESDPSAARNPLCAGVVCESYPDERRVALTPSSVPALKKAKLDVLVQAGAGSAAGHRNADYAAQGAEIIADRNEVFSRCGVLLQVRAGGANPDAGQGDLAAFRPGQTIIGLCDPLARPDSARALAERGVMTFALELLPRITRAQSMDVLSSMASIAGYKAVILAANLVPKLYPMMMTAAGTISAAKVFVIGAGVAGLQAIATARRLGAVVKATDVRSAARDDVLSLGAKFVEMSLGDAAGTGGYAKAMDADFYKRQQEMIAPAIAESDVVITTAAVPGRRAPLLISAEAVRSMAPGSIVVDLAAEQGGNCELTKPRETITENGVLVVGCVNLPATVPFHASQMFSRNATAFLLSLVKEGRWAIDRDDEIVQGTLVTADGQVVHPRVRELLGQL